MGNQVAARVPEVANAANMAARNRLISKLDDERPEIYAQFLIARLAVDGTQSFVHGSSRFPLTSFGRINLAPLFAELSLNLIRRGARSGLVLPTGIVTDSFTQHFCRHILEKKRVASLTDFENRESLFPGVHSGMKFLLLTFSDSVDEADFLIFATNVAQIPDQRRHFTLTADDIALINPNTRTCPVFRSKADAELTKKTYMNVPAFVDDALGSKGNPWATEFKLIFMMNTDSHLFRTASELIALGGEQSGPDWVLPGGQKYLRLYEGKMYGLANPRAADVVKSETAAIRQNQPSYLTAEELEDSARLAIPLYWVPENEVRARSRVAEDGWMIGVLKVTSPTIFHTFIASVLPKAGAGDSAMIIESRYAYDNQGYSAALIGCLNSISFDYFARQKIGGVNMNFYIQKQLPVIPPSAFSKADIEFISGRIKQIYCTSDDMVDFAESIDGCRDLVAYNDVVVVNARAELDAFYAHLYGLTRDGLRYVLDPADVMGPDYPSETFRVLKTNELRQFGEYRTQRLVLEAWDRLFGAP